MPLFDMVGESSCEKFNLKQKKISLVLLKPVLIYRWQLCMLLLIIVT